MIIEHPAAGACRSSKRSHLAVNRTHIRVAEDDELPLNLSTKNRRIWSPGSACEKKHTAGAESPETRDASPEPLELVKRCRSSPQACERAPSEPRRCPSAPAPHPPPVLIPTAVAELNRFSLVLKNENKIEKIEKTFQCLRLHNISSTQADVAYERVGAASVCSFWRGVGVVVKIAIGFNQNSNF
ncbi:hypothetical protein EVAR_55812_1 [Eumeta japonica]|uniref:Uncharacterized protein n=1 Tax=Eumeta variegata TaxID=151549 RepID=A0A4C1ZDJ5_EUMVA|nr:hypothetical protein EVAR_55812_1 [Eumeta japonica]